MNKKKVSTRIRLIRAAITQFQLHGYNGTSTQDVLDVSGIPRGSLYHHFPGGKADLAMACVDTLTQDLIERIRALRLSGNSAVQVIETLASGIADWLESKDWKEGMLIPVLTHEFAGKDPKMHDALQQSYYAVLAEFTQMFVVEGQSERGAQASAQRVLVFLEGGASLARALKSRAPLVDSSMWRIQPEMSE